MASSRRRKLTLILLLFYWPTIFILAHIPIPRLVRQMQVSDKTLHYLAYLILVFLLWFAINPDRKVNWRRATVWWVLLAVVWYAVVDEWLQGYVGRNADVMDFLADLAGALTGLIALSIFPFWPVSLMLTGSAIFVLTNFIQSGPAENLFVINIAFHLFGYALFSLLWTRYMYHLLPVRPPQAKWLIGALAIPTCLLLSVELFSAVAGNGFRLQDVIISLAAIAAVAAVSCMVVLFRRRFAQKGPLRDSERSV